MNNHSLFQRSNKLLLGPIYSDIKKYPTFLHIKSIFDDEWYNFIVPQVEANEFEWKEADKVVKEEREKGVKLSFYIPQARHKEYRKLLTKKGSEEAGDETYMFLTLEKPYDDVEPQDFIAVDETTIKEYISLGNECFPDWENQERYSRHFFDLSSQDSNKIFKNVLLKSKGQFVSFGSLIVSKRFNLAYLHYLGTAKMHRRWGFGTKLTKHLANLAFREGATDIYAIVEEGAGSYHLLSKLGFKSQQKFYLFAT